MAREVYIVWAHEKYEGDRFVEIYEREQTAKQEVARLKKEEKYGLTYSYSCHTVKGPTKK